MTISEVLADEPGSKEKLKELLKEAYPRLEEMYLGSPALTIAQQIFFVDQLIKIDPYCYEVEIRRALKTNQGITRTMEEFAGRAPDDKILRNKLRSAVLLKAAVIQLSLGERASSSKNFAGLRDVMKSLLGQRNVGNVEKHINESVTVLKVCCDTQESGLDQIVQRHLDGANLESANTIIWRVNEEVSSKIENTLSNMKMNLINLKNDKFNQFQRTWNSQAGPIAELGTILDGVNKTFMEALEKDDAQFAAARDFKDNCVKELFKAVAIYAPSPFDVIGTTGVAICGFVEIAGSAAEAATAFAKRNLVSGEVKAAIEKAEASIETAKTRVYDDHGIQTNIQGVTKDIILKAQERAAQGFYDALAGVKLDSGRSTLEDKVRRQRNINVLETEVVRATNQFEEALAKIKLPNLSVNKLGNERLLKRCLYLYLTGLYIEAKMKENKNKFFKLQTNMCDLLKSKDVAFFNEENERKNGDLGLSLPYFCGYTAVRHDATLVRVNAILLRYSKSTDYNPFAIMLNPRIDAAAVTGYFDQQDIDISAEINTAKEQSASSAKRAKYHEIERSEEKITDNLLLEGPLRPDGSF